MTGKHWKKELTHRLWQYDNRLDLDEEHAKAFYQQWWEDFIEGIVTTAIKEERERKT